MGCCLDKRRIRFSMLCKLAEAASWMAVWSSMVAGNAARSTAMGLEDNRNLREVERVGEKGRKKDGFL